MDDKAFREIREIEVELTAACTRSCAFCTPGLPEGRRVRPKYLPLSRADMLAKELTELRYAGWVTLCGWGEPTLASDLPVILNILSELKGKTGTKIRLFTNGDTLQIESLDRDSSLRERTRGTWRGHPVDDLVVSVYDSGPGAQAIFDRMGYLSKVRIQDHRGRDPDSYSTRAGNVKPYPPEYEVRLARRRHTPCEWFRTQLFLTAEGHWVTCCNDMRQIHTWEGGVADLFSDPDYLAMRAALADPAVDRRTLEPCAKCESA